MAPLASMNWVHARATYVLLCSLLYGHLLYSLAGLIGADWRSWRRWGFIAFGLAFAPVHTGLAAGNLSILGFILCMYSLLLAQEKMEIAPGLLMGLALCIKPTVGILILLYMLVGRRWRLLCAGIGLTALITGIAMLRMSAIPSVWHTDYQQNMAFLVGPSGAGNFASASSVRFDLLNLQLPVFEIVHSKGIANLLTYLIVCILGIVWLWLFVEKRKLHDCWEASGALILLGLLPIYQRNYNAAFVLIPLLWAFQNIKLPVAKWIMAISAIFLVPGEAFLRHFRIPDALYRSMFWNFVVMPQAIWGVLAIALLLLGVMSSMPGASSSQNSLKS